MQPAHLYLSFWDVILDNLPEGTFRHRRLATDEARKLIEDARTAGTLRGVSRDDLCAPHREKKLKDHESLRLALREEHGIRLSLDDFTIGLAEDGRTIHPLDFVAVSASSQLMVVSCDYALSPECAEPLMRFVVAPDSVSFHLFEEV